MLISATDICFMKGFVIKTNHVKEETLSFYDPETNETKTIKQNDVDYFIPDYKKFRRWFFKSVCGKDYDEVKNNPRDEYFNFYCRVSCMGRQDPGYVGESLLNQIIDK